MIYDGEGLRRKVEIHFLNMRLDRLGCRSDWVALFLLSMVFGRIEEEFGGLLNLAIIVVT